MEGWVDIPSPLCYTIYMSKDVIPMTSARIYEGRYEVLGTSTCCIIERCVGTWVLKSDGKPIKDFATKREALQYCQEHSEL